MVGQITSHFVTEPAPSMGRASAHHEKYRRDQNGKRSKRGTNHVGDPGKIFPILTKIAEARIALDR